MKKNLVSFKFIFLCLFCVTLFGCAKQSQSRIMLDSGWTWSETNEKDATLLD